MTDPATDARADYDYAGGATAGADLVGALDERIDGEVRFDEYTRQLYATDASAYEVTPVGVVFPTDADDVAAVVGHCADRGVAVLPRGGGTSLAGQAVNEAVVLDFTRHMDAVLSVDPDAGTATAQPGIYLADLDDALAGYGLKFAPDPAWGDKSALGGAIGNNSTGAHSLQYGKTDAYVESCEVVLADGTRTEFGELSLPELRERAGGEGLEGDVCSAVARLVDEEAGTVRGAFPDLDRNVSGYDLDRLVEDAASGTVNLARLLAGSEGTLAVVTRATVSLEPVPATKAMALLGYDDLPDAMSDVQPVLEHDPAAVEVLDDVLLELAADTSEFGPLVDEVVPDGVDSVLLVEFYAGDDGAGRRRVADLVADRGPDVATTAEPPGSVRTGPPTRAVHAAEAHDEAERERFWTLRKSGLPILLGRTSDAKHVSFVEDTAVPPERLPEFVADFRRVLDEHDTYASFYGHAGPGCLHVRPLVNTKTVEGVERMRSIAEDVTDLVVAYGGSVSGEHGDGRARTRWSRRQYGEDVWELFRDLKTAFDPDWLLNPGQVCGEVAPTEHLRFDPDYEFDAGFEPALRWENDNGMAGMVELCHGCGGCRGPQETTGGVMCPTFRASDEEITSTRGRANALRGAMSGDLPADPAGEEFATEVLDLCIGCKGCATDCPSEVDMAKLKAEVEHARHREHGASLRERLFADVHRLARWGSRLAPASNWLAGLPGARAALERTLGVAREPPLPAFASESLVAWAADADAGPTGAAADHRVVVVADPFTNFVDPEIGRAAVRVLAAAGVHVDVVDPGPTGRPALSKGFVDRARERAAGVVDALAPRVAEGWSVVCAEPSTAVMLQADYADLLAGPDVDAVREATFGVCEYLDRRGLADEVAWDAPAEALSYHGHCHQTAARRDHHAVGVLRRAGYDVDPVDSTCCGMAGSFGYEAEHRSMSSAIADILFDQLDAAAGERVVAPGASCRTQLTGYAGGRPDHPVEALAAALP